MQQCNYSNHVIHYIPSSCKFVPSDYLPPIPRSSTPASDKHKFDSVNSISQTYFYCEFYFKMQHMLISYVPVSKVNDGLIITFPDRKKHKISIKRTSRKIKDQILFSPVMYSTLSSFR